MLVFITTQEDDILIRALAKRASELATTHGVEYDVRDANMDLAACHANGCPLDLKQLAGFDDANFGHDVFGIRRHLSRKTGHLGDTFCPRCALPKSN